MHRYRVLRIYGPGFLFYCKEGTSVRLVFQTFFSDQTFTSPKAGEEGPWLHINKLVKSKSHLAVVSFLFPLVHFVLCHVDLRNLLWSIIRPYNIFWKIVFFSKPRPIISPTVSRCLFMCIYLSFFSSSLGVYPYWRHIHVISWRHSGSSVVHM